MHNVEHFPRSVLSNINIVQTYAPTADAADEDIEAYYEQLDGVVNEILSNEILMVIGDINAKVGSTSDEQLKAIIGPFGLGRRNKRGNRLLQLCQEHSLTIAVDVDM